MVIIVENCLVASFGMSGMSGTSGMSGMSGVSDVSNIFYRTKSSETFLLQQFFSNSASETILLLLQNWDVRDVRGVREVRDARGVRVVSNFSFRTKSSEQYLLEQFFSNSASETILLLLQNWDVRGVRVVSNFSFRTKSSEQYLLEQFFSNSASETILLNNSSSASVVEWSMCIGRLPETH